MSHEDPIAVPRVPHQIMARVQLRQPLAHLVGGEPGATGQLGRARSLAGACETLGHVPVLLSPVRGHSDPACVLAPPVS